MSDEKPEPTVYAPGLDLPPPPPGRPPVRWGLMSLIALFIIGAVALIIGPNFVRPRGGGQLTACKSNCKNLATALEMYASDNGGLYPVSMAQLIGSPGNYLKTIPTCPSAGTDTYSGSYQCATTPDSFTLYCAGLNHAMHYAGLKKDSTNFPQYLCEQGLREQP